MNTKNPGHHPKNTTYYILDTTSSERGFTLYEVLIYLALFLVLSVLIVGLVVQMLSGGFKQARTREVVSSVNSAFTILLNEGKFSQEVYEPTSVFNSNASQISLRTQNFAPAGESFAFVDFYLDNGRLFIKRESEGTAALTSDRVHIDRFWVARMNPVTTSDSLRIGISAHHRFSRSVDEDVFAATTTVTLRRY